MLKEKISHVHAEVMKIWLDDMSTPIEWREFDKEGWMDVGATNEPAWYPQYQYRVKPKEYPKSTLDDDYLENVYARAPNSFKLSIRAVADEAIKHFIESGDMLKYFVDPANGFMIYGSN